MSDKPTEALCAEKEDNNHKLYEVPSCFRINEGGVFYVDPDPEKPASRLCSKLEVIAYTHDEEDRSHGRLLKWVSVNTGRTHQWAMPCSMLAGEGIEIRQKLLDEGLTIEPGRKQRDKLLEYIQAVKPTEGAISLSRIGWHDSAFAFPDQVYPPSKKMVLQHEGNSFGAFRIAGTLEEWRKHVAVYAQGNSRLIFALSIAFVAPLLKIANEESGIVHFVGASSQGKTSTLRIAASIWGGGGENGYIKQWRATANAMEAIAESHRDSLLPLDELGQADSKTIGDTVYMLANNQGKGRMRNSATLKSTLEWRVCVISSGEITLETKLAEVNKKTYAGMEVRFISIPAQVEGAHGVFENLHGFKGGHEFSRHLQDMCSKYYGTPIRAFIGSITNEENYQLLAEEVRKLQNEFIASYLPDNASGQVKRVAMRFGLIAAAGELAIILSVLPFKAGEAIAASGQCFKDWLNTRGSVDYLEVEKGIAQIRAYIERYGASKFVTLDEEGKENKENPRPLERVGYRQRQDDIYQYFVLPEAYKTELCRGYDPKHLTKALADRGHLIKDPMGKNQVLKTFPGESRKEYTTLTHPPLK